MHVRDSVRQIDETSWLVGTKHILRHIQGPSKDDNFLWKNPSDGSHYTLSAVPEPPPAGVGPLIPGAHACQIHDAGDVSAVFNFGDALIIKVRTATAETRREPETLAFLSRQQLTFDIPTVLSFFEDAAKTYLIEPCAPGRRLNEAWWDMAEEDKEHVVTRVAEICAEVKKFESNVLTGVDYNWLDPLQEPGTQTVDLLQQHCEELGMDSSVFVLAHNDLGPTNIMVKGGRIMVLDWELAGYVPLEWVRTKFGICGAYCVERGRGAGLERDFEYTGRVERKLGEMGFPEVIKGYNRRDQAVREERERNRR